MAIFKLEDVQEDDMLGEGVGGLSSFLLILSWNLARENRLPFLKEVDLVESVSVRASRDPWSTCFFLYSLCSVCHTW